MKGAAVWGEEWVGMLTGPQTLFTCVNSRITGANISQNSVVPVPSEKMKLRPFILLFSNLIYFA